jgi:lycopene cyclase domain-containing protein
MNYLGLNAIFLAALLVAALAVRNFLPWKIIWQATAALLLLTAIFDNAIIGFGIVAYDESQISGIKLGLAPIEDFAYALASPLLISIAMEVTKRLRNR